VVAPALPLKDGMQPTLIITGKEDIMGHGRLRFVLIAALWLIVAWAFAAEVMLSHRSWPVDAPASEEALDASR
jgi:hypothetical protein